MADLRGGSTVGGRPILGKEARDNYLGMVVGNRLKESLIYQNGTTLEVGGDLKLASGKAIYSGHNNAGILIDHANGHITLSGAGGDLYLGYQNTVKVRLEKALFTNAGATLVIDTAGKLYYQGNDTDGRYLGISANAVSASKLATARTISLTGDVAGSVSFDGSGNVSFATTYKNSGVTAGTYRSVTVDAKGSVTGGTNPTTLAGYGITDAETPSGAQTKANTAETNAKNASVPRTTRNASGDWNNYKEAGFFDGSSMTNACPGDHAWRYCIVIPHSANPSAWVTQVQWDFDTPDRMYTRMLVNSVWSAWKLNGTNNFNDIGSLVIPVGVDKYATA